VIATMKVLGLLAAAPGGVAAAAFRVARYVEGGADGEHLDPRQGEPPAPGEAMAGYYAGKDGGSGEPAEVAAAVAKERLARGEAKGAAAELMGLRGRVSNAQLRRLLAGRHAVTGRPLVSAAGSAGRARHDTPAAADGPSGRQGRGTGGMVPISEAARILGVSPQYLRRVAGRTARAGTGGTSGTPGGTRAAAVPPGGTGRAGRAAPARLAAVRDRVSGRWLVPRAELERFAAQRRPPTVVMAYDLTCAAPKSVSLLWAFGGDRIRAAVLAAVDAGVDAVLGYLERHAAVGTVGGRTRHGAGLAAACYRHEVSRADEAHLHVHVLFANAVPIPLLDADGRPVLDADGVARVVWRTLDSEVLLAHLQAAGYLGAAALRHELSRQLGVAWGPVRNGVAEIAGFPRDLLDAFSSRVHQVLISYDELVAAGFAPGGATLAAAQRASRAAKKVRADAQTAAVQRARLAAAGWTPEQVRALVPAVGREVAPPGEADIAALFDRLAGPGGLTAGHPTFTHREVVQAVAAWARDRLPAEAITRIAEVFLADPCAVLLDVPPRRRRHQPEPTYTTLNLLEAEDSLLALCRQGRVGNGGTPRAPVAPALAERAIADTGAALPGGLSGEQAALVRAVLACGDLVRPVVGPAGAGKTEALRVASAAWAAAGHNVIGAANGGRQAEELGERLDVGARVVSAWLTLLDHSQDLAEVWEPGTVVVLDEATQVSTRDAERLLRHATRTGAVVVAVGDPAQLGSVGAGGWFAHLVTTTPDVPELTANQRQRGPRMAHVRAALAGLRSGVPADTRAALDRLAADGRIELCDTGEQLLAAVVGDWHAEHHAHRRRHPGAVGSRPVMMAERHADADLLNRAARARLAADGQIGGPTLNVAGREFQAGDEVITLTQAGHTLVPAGRPKSAYIRTGTRGVVTAVHRQALTVRFPHRGDVRVPWEYLTHQFPDGRDGGLAHAYALTAHKAEGATLPTARAVVAEDTSRAGLYVMLSRAQTDLRAYLIRRHELADPADPLEEDWLPVLADGAGPADALADHLDRSRPERLAGEHDPIAHAAHRLRQRHTLAELAQLRQDAAPGTDAMIVRRAEIAAETAIAATAVTGPPPRLVERIGSRPDSGAERVVWEQAVTALAVYHARHQPDALAHELGPRPSPTPADEAALRWQRLRTAAERLAGDWPASIGGHHQTVPRDRAVAGLHALLDHGWAPDALAAALTERELGAARAGAAVLDHRVRRLLRRAGIDPAAYDLPPPMTAAQEWRRAADRLAAAEADHLARRPTADLRVEHDQLRVRLNLTSSSDPGWPTLRQRLGMVDNALARQLDHAAARIEQEPAGYLVALLGDPPDHPALAAEWRRRALAVEHYRHYTLGLPYGALAAASHAPASQQALGPPPANPVQRHQWERLRGHQQTLDLGMSL
jgi:conjugative relaxase-like TrwC/TraI family protein